MLSEYKGASNSGEVFRHLVGERIMAAFEDEKGHVVLVMESGPALVLGSLGGGSPAYWTTSKEDIDMLVAERRKAIEGRLAELRDLPGVALP